MKYEILINGNYFKEFKKYSNANEELKRLQRKFPKARIQIVEKY